MNLLRLLKKKSRNGSLPNPIGLLSTCIPSQPIICANCKVQAQSSTIVQHRGSYIVIHRYVANMNKNNNMIL